MSLLGAASSTRAAWLAPPALLRSCRIGFDRPTDGLRFNSTTLSSCRLSADRAESHDQEARPRRQYLMRSNPQRSPAIAILNGSVFGKHFHSKYSVLPNMICYPDAIRAAIRAAIRMLSGCYPDAIRPPLPSTHTTHKQRVQRHMRSSRHAHRPARSLTRTKHAALSCA